MNDDYRNFVRDVWMFVIMLFILVALVCLWDKLESNYEKQELRLNDLTRANTVDQARYD